MKRVVSLALFRPERNIDKTLGTPRGISPFYEAYLPLWLRAFAECWPGWELRLYHDETLYGAEYGPAVMRAADAGLVRLIYAGPSRDVCRSMLWRFLPMFDSTVEYFAPRDLDACPAPREWRSIQKWIAEEPRATCHMIHDSESHGGIMGGMGCFRAEAFRRAAGNPASFTEFASKFGTDLSVFGSDQDFLASIIGKPDRLDQFPKRDPNDPRDNFGHIGGAIQTQGAISWYDRCGAPKHAAKIAEAEAPLLDDVRHVVLASTADVGYSFFLPITCRLWLALGYKPLVKLIGNPGAWMERLALRLVVEETCRAGARIHWKASQAPYADATLAQWSRLFGYCTERLNPASWIITSDVDMWPLSAQFFDRRTDGFALWYANAYGPGTAAPKWPLCYLGANYNIWQAVMGPIAPVREKTLALLSAEIGTDPSAYAGRSPSWSDVQWFGDEEAFAKRLKAWAGFPRNLLLIDREGCPPRDRVDRSAWPAEASPVGMSDAHLLRPGHTDENWPRIARLLPGPVRDWADDYRRRFVEAIR